MRKKFKILMIIIFLFHSNKEILGQQDNTLNVYAASFSPLNEVHQRGRKSKKIKKEVNTVSQSLVPSIPSTVPDYFCTWNAQGFACSYEGALKQADMMVESSLFGTGPNQNWIDFYPKVRSDLTFLLDDAFDFPVGVERNHPSRGSIELHPSRFPSYQGDNPIEGLSKLSKDIKARGWRDLGLWICNSRPNNEGLPISSDDYWTERLAWSQKAGIGNWKVDWGIGSPDKKPLWKFRVTPAGRKAAPDVWIEFGKQGDLYRTYDVHVYNSIPETILRIGKFLADEDPKDHRLINCEDEVYIGAGLATSYGVMRHPLVGNMPNGKPDRFFVEDFRDLKHRMDEVVRAVRWHRIAQPIPKGGEYKIDSTLLTSFKSKSAPARMTRGGVPLPEVKMADGSGPPHVLASRHLDGEIAVATIPRNFEVNGSRSMTFPLADVVIDIGDGLNRPVGIFGKYRSLTLISTHKLTGKRILAQDLAGDSPTDITDQVQIKRGRLTIPGAVIDRVGLMASTPDDISDPGLVLVVEGLSEYVPKRPMHPIMFTNPDAQH
jgi:hypothetical protein